MALKASLVITGDAASATAALNQVDDALERNVGAAKRAAAANDELGRKVEKSSRQAQAGYVNLGRQVQDVAVQLQSGTNLGTIVAQQGGQIADAVAQMGGRFSGLASFLAGPWGAVLTVAAGVGINLAMAMRDAGDAADEHAKKQLTLYDALQKSAAGTEDARAALVEYNAEQRRAATQTDSMIKLNLASAEARLKDALGIREQLAAELARRTASANNTRNAEDPTGALMLAGSTEGKIAENDQRVSQLEQAIRNLGIQDAVRDAAGIADPIKGINNRYDDMAEAAKRAARGNAALAASLKVTLTTIEVARRKELEQQRASSRSSSSSSGVFGREIDLSQARSIARGAGFQVNSGHRSYSQQKSLYDAWVRAGRPSNNPVAAPGSSAHERDNALDIQYGKGVTAASLRKVYAAEGVRLTKILPEKGHFHIEWSTSGADKIEREAEQVANWGEQVAARIAGIRDQFSDIPPVVARANAATRDLDKTIADLSERKPPGFEQMIADAEALKDVVEASLVKPFTDYLERAREGAAIDQLLLAGKRDQAVALQDALSLQRQMGPLTQEQLDAIQDTVVAERERGELLQRHQEAIGTYLDATRSVRSEIEGILAGTGKLSNLPQVFKNLQAKVLAEKLFGPMFRDLDRWVQTDSGLKESTEFFAEQTKGAGNAAFDLAAAFREAGGQIRAAAGGAGSTGSAFDAAFADLPDPTAGVPSAGDGEIVVTGNRPVTGSLLDVTVDEYMRRMTEGVASSLVTALNGATGTQFFGKFTGSLAGAMQGYMVSGGSPFGAALGALKEIPGLPKGIADKLGGAFKGMATGAQIAGLAGAFGIKLSNTGSQIGGAIGGALPIPGGAIIGSLLGGVVGGLFKKAKTGAVSIGSVNGEGAITGTAGNNADRKNATTSAGNSINDMLAQFAERLGGTIGSYSVAIGMRKDEYRVSGSGSASATTKKKTSSDIIYKGKDEGEAIKAALANAIADGAIEGVSVAVQKALKAMAGNADKALAEALKVQELETLLGGVTGAIDKAFADFDRQAKERLRIATAYGFDVVTVEELNAKQRLKLSEQLLEQQVGSLQRLIDEMTGGSLFEGSAVDKRSALLEQIAAAKTEADAGTEGAADKLAGLLEQLNAVSKDVYGTTGGFATDRTAILDQARDVIAQANQRIADAQAKSDPALATTNAALDENNNQNAEMIALLRDLGGNFPPPNTGASSYAGLARLASTRAN